MGNPIKRIIYQTLKYPLIAWMAFKSLPAARQAAITPDTNLFETPYQGQPILLVALFQQGKLRPDIARLLTMAKESGHYVIAVNNANVNEPMTPYADCYIERYNFGRDFGSYKTGFDYIFQQLDTRDCPRLLMLNDSVYYDTTRLNRFLETLTQTRIEVLGATENHEITHHLGSFCVSIDNKVLHHPIFKQYWAHYKLTDVRLLVIYRGELGLSACLKQCVSSPQQFRALYDIDFLAQSLTNEHNLDTFRTLARRSTHLTWPKLSPSASVADILAYSRIRSQIHINNTYLVYLGLPIVKLDGFYRGVFSAEDVLLICTLLPELEADELKALLFRKSYGGDTLFGFNKILYMWGLI